MSDLIAGVLNSLDDFLLAIQRWFCHHKPLPIGEWDLVCEKCGKLLWTFEECKKNAPEAK